MCKEFKIVYGSDTYSNIASSDLIYFFYCLADINTDKKVDGKDIAAVAKQFGKIC